MKAYAVEDSSFPLIQQTAQDIAQQAAQGGNVAQLIYEATKSKLQFTLDVDVAEAHELKDKDNVVEVLTRPADVELLSQLRPVIGDCDDFSMYAASLALALQRLGFPISNVRFVTIAAEHGSNDYSHVYVRINVNGKTVAIDASHGPEAGWEASNQATRLCEYPLNNSNNLLLAAAALAAAYYIFRG